MNLRLEGLHHVTAITADAPGNVDFYAGVLGLRLVKKTVNFDAPDVYHLYYGDERGSPGSLMTFFELADAARGRAGRGMVNRVVWRVAGEPALDFWARRLGAVGIPVERDVGTLVFADPEGLALELRAAPPGEAPLAARAPDIPPEHALLGLHGVHAYTDPSPEADRLLGALGFGAGPEAGIWELVGSERRARYAQERPAPARGVPGAGTVHHVAWASRDEDHAGWRQRVADAGAGPTPIVDRTYFRSIYFREPGGILFEIATLSPGFAVDEAPERLGEALALPPRYEPLRGRLERELTPLVNPRAARASA